MSSVTVAGINLGNVNEGSTIPFGDTSASLNNVWEVISQAYPNADRSRTTFGFTYVLSGVANTVDFNSGDLSFSQFLVYTDGFVQYTSVRTINDTTIEGNEAFSFQPVLQNDQFALDIRDGNGVIARLNPDQINSLFASAGGITFNIGALTGTIIDNDFPNQPPTAVNFINTTPALAENTSTASRIKVADIVITDDALGTNNLSLSGTDAAIFEIQGTGLFIKAGTTLNFEAKSSYSVTVNVDDTSVGSTPDASRNYTLTVTNVNEAPTAVVLNNVVSAIAENTSTASRIKVADLAITDDALGTNNLSLSGADAASFEILSNALYVRAGTTLNFEAKSSYSVTVNVDDSTVGSTPDATANFTLTLTNVNEAPTVALNNQVNILAENTNTTNRVKVAGITITDDTLGTNNLSLSGTDAALFEIIGAELFIKAGTVLDFETNPILDVTVKVDDPALGSTFEDSVDFSLSLQSLSLVVDTLVDENDGNFSAGDLSLREALARIADGGTITFANSLAGGTITLTAGQLVINKSLTLDGDINGDNGADITISGNNASRVFLIDDGNGSNLAQVKLSALTITGGNIYGGGGGIVNRENLSLNNSTLSGNSANFGGGIAIDFGTVTVTNSTLSGNSANFGGGIAIDFGTVTITNSTLSGNSALGVGGGIIIKRGTATITNSTISGNSTNGGGGGINNDFGTATITNSTISGNSTNDVGGGILNIYGTATVTNSTISGNSALDGGGIFSGSVFEPSATTSLTSAIVANNTARNSGNDLVRQAGTINASNSLIENNADKINGTNTNNITGVDPLLGPLQNNGGPTQTLALLPGSPAINAGSNPNNLTTDQRGFGRSIGAGVDIGAVELVSELVVDTLVDENDGDFSAGDLSLREAWWGDKSG